MIRAALAVAALLALAAPARAAGTASYALLIGVNRSVDAEARPLRYADDDVARYRDLFAALGVRTHLLATLDENTRRLHPAAAAEAVAPRAAALQAAVDQLASEVSQAHAAGEETVLYVVYAGHGNADSGSGYVTLEDRRLTGAELAREVLDRIRARREHLVIDACSSYLFVAGRGAGGERRPLQGFSRAGGDLLARPNLGLLLSTSSARESHEWSAFQAGVFSHEVRSGMFGAADSDGDETITYPEIAAFVRRANEAIPNERFRPEVFWRSPAQGPAFVDLRRALARRVEVPGSIHGHYYLEDPRGVRLADFHNGRALGVRLLRPEGDPRLYLIRAADQRSFLLPAQVAVLDASRLPPEEAPVSARGAAHEAFQALFALPFDGAAVAGAGPAGALAARPAATGDSTRRRIGWGLLGLSALGTAAGVGTWLSAASLRDDLPEGASHRETFERNGRIADRNRLAGAALGLAGVAAAAGVALLLWPDAAPSVEVVASGQLTAVTWRGRF